MKFIFSWKKDLTSERSERVKYFFHSKINFTCSRHRVISIIYEGNSNAWLFTFGSCNPPTGVFSVVVRNFFTVYKNVDYTRRDDAMPD